MLKGSTKYNTTATIAYPCVIRGQKYIVIGDNTAIDKYGTITALKRTEKEPQLVIGNNCSIGAFSHITCVNKIMIGNNVLFGKWVTITDNSHGSGLVEEVEVAPMDRQVYSKGPVIIENNVWIGDKVTILPDVKVGEGSIVGANAVVTKNIPPYSIVAGNPARLIKIIK